MTANGSHELRTLIRQLALKQASVDRRQLYWALIHAQVWTPVAPDSTEGAIDGDDLCPLAYEGLNGAACYGVFTHLAAAEVWQAEDAASDTPMRLETLPFSALLPALLSAGAGSILLNPESTYSGELYRHELQTCLDGHARLARREALRQSEPPNKPAAARRPWRHLLSRIVGRRKGG